MREIIGKSKWLKNQIKRYEYMKPRNKRETTEIQTAVIMILFVVIVVMLIVKEVMF